ncbi:MAG: N-acetyltransferase family protein [Bacteriovoracaceae bacterium]
MNSIKLKEITKSDLEGLQTLVEVIRTHYSNTSFPFTLEKAQNPALIFFRAFYQNEFIGVTGLDAKTPLLAETIKTVILPEHRGKKLGALLSQAIEDECRRRGFKKVMTTIYADNHAMISIKLKQGYTIEGYHPDHEAPGFHEYSLGKILNLK